MNVQVPKECSSLSLVQKPQRNEMQQKLDKMIHNWTGQKAVGRPGQTIYAEKSLLQKREESLSHSPLSSFHSQIFGFHPTTLFLSGITKGNDKDKLYYRFLSAGATVCCCRDSQTTLIYGGLQWWRSQD